MGVMSVQNKKTEGFKAIVTVRDLLEHKQNSLRHLAKITFNTGCWLFWELTGLKQKFVLWTTGLSVATLRHCKIYASLKKKIKSTLILHVSFWVCWTSEWDGKPQTFRHIPSVVTHKHNNIQTDKVWIPRGTKTQFIAPQTLFHCISKKIKNQLLHCARDVRRNRWMGLGQMFFKVTEVCTKWLFSKTRILNYSTWHEHSLCGVQMERTLRCCFAAA